MNTDLSLLIAYVISAVFLVVFSVTDPKKNENRNGESE